MELPSQFLENFLFDDATMRSIARHYQTDEVIPQDTLAKLRHIHREQFCMFASIEFAALDLDLHLEM